MSYGVGFQYRNPTAWDKQIGDLGTAGNWHDLDLSSVVPAGAKAILCKVNSSGTTPTDQVALMMKGGNGTYSYVSIAVQVNGVANNTNLIVPVNEDRVIEQFRDTSITVFNIAIIGWWL